MSNAGINKIIDMIKGLEEREEPDTAYELQRLLQGLHDAKLMLQAIALTIGEDHD